MFVLRRCASSTALALALAFAAPHVASAQGACDAGALCGDDDQDGFLACGCPYAGTPCDCDDADPATFPGSPEACDAPLDRNCNGAKAERCPAKRGCLGSVCVPECIPLSDFGCTQDELARRIGRSRPQVSNTLRLLKLPPDVQRRVAAGVLSAGHARALLSLDDQPAMEALATRIVAEGLSVRAVEEIIIVGDADGRQRKPSPRARVSVPRDASITEAITDLSASAADSLDTRVHAEGFAGLSSRGRLVIECADLEDLRRVVDLIARD